MHTHRDPEKERRRITEYADRDLMMPTQYGTIRLRTWLLRERARLARKGWPCVIARNGNPRNLALFRKPMA